MNLTSYQGKIKAVIMQTVQNNGKITQKMCLKIYSKT